MKQFLTFVRKEFYHIFRDRRTTMILLGMPIVQIVLFGFAITTEVKNVRLVVLDPSQDVSTQHIVERFRGNHYFDVVGEVANNEEIIRYFQRGKASIALVFENNFDENIRRHGTASVQLIADATDPNTATISTNYAASIINDFQQDMVQGQPQQLQIQPLRIVPEIKMLYNPQMKSAYNFVPGVMGFILMLICSMMTSISIVREKEMGMMEVLLVSPMRPFSIILAKMVPYLVISTINLITILLLSIFVLGVPVAGSFFWLGFVSILLIVVALCLGLLISTISANQVTAMMISGMAMMMPVMMLSGMIFPVENMPGFLRVISSIIPARWYIQAVKKLMIEGLGVQYVLKEIAILSAMAIVLMVVSIKKFKNRLE